MEDLLCRIKKIEYHQRLLLKMIENQNYPVYELFVKKDLSEVDAAELFSLCDELTLKLETQKEEGFVYFTPLLTEFIRLLNPKLEPKETINAFLKQNLYRSLMEELEKSFDCQ
ncbi:DUF1878 family protein [Calidifontibacillus oryziterrae]|uniref:DUF1878 family protein n=1 Tax=Calidifontibacillus oryziterrae TaxID=1191699 RepID=UPI0002FF6064|nr:DUF1878 family protein [Calidifontibacillus oryziterrae]